jgi:hypothetical protein
VAVRVNQGRDGMSLVVASIYCSPHPAALQIDTPPGSGGLCLYDSAPGELLNDDDWRNALGATAKSPLKIRSILVSTTQSGN